ncbi:hypothetical protein ACFS07_07445 [Undibacterium arcticum]
MYFQFDFDEFFFSSHTYGNGYYDYCTDGFGPVATTIDQLESEFSAAIENRFSLGQNYRQRIDDFFAFNDGEKFSPSVR